MQKQLPKFSVGSTVLATKGHTRDADLGDEKSIYWKAVTLIASSLPRAMLSRIIYIKSGYFRI
jgi:hypothetical protein